MKALKECREKLDSIDSEIVRLIYWRLEICREIGEIKDENEMPVYVPEREAEAIRERVNMARRFGLSGEFVRRLFQLIMEESRSIQSMLRRILK